MVLRRNYKVNISIKLHKYKNYMTVYLDTEDTCVRLKQQLEKALSATNDIEQTSRQMILEVKNELQESRQNLKDTLARMNDIHNAKENLESVVSSLTSENQSLTVR